MSTNRVSAGWNYVRRYAGPVISAALIYTGLEQIVDVLRIPLANGFVLAINFIIRRGFRDRILIDEFGWIPARYHLPFVAMAMISIVLGVFVGLWVNLRKRQEAASS